MHSFSYWWTIKLLPNCCCHKQSYHDHFSFYYLLRAEKSFCRMCAGGEDCWGLRCTRQSKSPSECLCQLKLRPATLEGPSFPSPVRFVYLKNIYLFIWLHWLAGPWLLFLGSWWHAGTFFLFSCGMWDLGPWTEIKPGPPALEAWNLSHWTTGEVSTFSTDRHMFFLI